MPDFLITDHFTLVQFAPMTDRACVWADEHIGSEAFVGRTFVAERRYAEPIVDGILGDGLTIA